MFYKITSILFPYLVVVIFILVLYLKEKIELLKIELEKKDFIVWCVADNSQLSRGFSLINHIKNAESMTRLEKELCIQDDEIPFLNDILQLFNHKILQAYFANKIDLVAVCKLYFKKENRKLADNTFFFFYYLNKYLNEKIKDGDFYIFLDKLIQSSPNNALTKEQKESLWKSYIEKIDIVITKLMIISLLYIQEISANMHDNCLIENLKKDIVPSVCS